MTKYIAKPIEVTAHRISNIGARGSDGSLSMILDGGEQVYASGAMLSRMLPVQGDYWVIQPDGYIYLNPKDVFESKYTPQAPKQSAGGGE